MLLSYCLSPFLGHKLVNNLRAQTLPNEKNKRREKSNFVQVCVLSLLFRQTAMLVITNGHALHVRCTYAYACALVYARMCVCAQPRPRPLGQNGTGYMTAAAKWLNVLCPKWQILADFLVATASVSMCSTAFYPFTESSNSNNSRNSCSWPLKPGPSCCALSFLVRLHGPSRPEQSHSRCQDCLDLHFA